MPGLPKKSDRSPEYYEHLARRRNPEHWPDCDCNQCWSTPISCIQCTNEFRSVRALRKHLHTVHSGKLTARERRQAAAKQVLVPDGLGYLHRVFASPGTVEKFNLKALSRFAEALANKKINGHTKRPQFTRRHRMELRQLELDGGASSVNTPLAPDAALAVYRLGCASGVGPAFVAANLINYGLEYLAAELKKHPVAPEHSKTPIPIKKEASEYNNFPNSKIAGTRDEVPRKLF